MRSSHTYQCIRAFRSIESGIRSDNQISRFPSIWLFFGRWISNSVRWSFNRVRQSVFGKSVGKFGRSFSQSVCQSGQSIGLHQVVWPINHIIFLVLSIGYSVGGQSVVRSAEAVIRAAIQPFSRPIYPPFRHSVDQSIQLRIRSCQPVFQPLNISHNQ